MLINIFIIYIIAIDILAVANYVPHDKEISNEFDTFIDIGYGFDDRTVYQVSKTPISIPQRLNDDRKVLSSAALTSYVASDRDGTHLDAPYHFHETGWKVADIPLRNLLVPGILLDMRNKTVDNDDFLIMPEHIIEWEQKYGPIPRQSVLLINFGWASRWNDKNSYLGLYDDDDDTTCHFPGLSEEAAMWIVDNKKIVGIGVDTASVDVGSTSDFKVHRILSSANIYNVENINFGVDTELPARGFDLIVMPTKINEAGGAPCRVIAVPPKHDTDKHTFSVKTNTVLANDALRISTIRISLFLFCGFVEYVLLT